MINTLRMIGLVNAAIWLGTVVFHVFVVQQAFSSNEMTRLLKPPYANAAELLVGKQFFLMNTTCALVALFYLITEWIYLGRRMTRVFPAVTLGLLILSVLGGGLVQKRLEHFHTASYVAKNEDVRFSARKSFRLWSGISRTIHFLLISGVGYYFWKVASPSDSQRSFRLHKVKG